MLRARFHLPLCALALAVATAAASPRVEDGKPAQKTGEAKEAKVVLPKVADGAKAELGKLAPDFALKDLDGKDVSLAKHLGKIVVLEWFDPLCPHCVQARGEGGVLRELPGRLKGQGVVWLTINSTEPAADGGKPQTNKDFAKKNGLQTPVCLDADGAVGRAYGARATPHCFVVNEKGVLVYSGALDNAPLGKIEGDQRKINYVEAAIADIKSGRAVATSETRPYGCTVKYAKPAKRRDEPAPKG